MSHSIPVAHFSTDAFPPAARYEAWRNLVSAVFEPKPASPTRGDMRARASSVHLGRVLVISAAAQAHHFIRTPRLIAAEGLDHYILQVYHHGVCDGAYADICNTVRPGDIKLVDMARPFSTSNTDFDNISLIIPRSALAPLLAQPDRLHGIVLSRDTATARVLAAHIRQLSADAASLSAEEAAALGTATVRLVAACLGSAARADDEARLGRIAITSQRVRDFIEQNLSSPALDPAMIAQAFRISRAQLYRLFPEPGGVADYIRTRRLRACLHMIADPTHAATAISAIAFRHGFSSEAHFSRAFRAAFGVTPTEARANAHGTPPRRAGDATFINDWMRGLAAPTTQETARQTN